jgi:hypothetical protein
MRCSHRFAGRRPIAAISAAGFMAGTMLAGGIAEISASTPPASAGVTNSPPPAPGPEVIRATLTSAGTPVGRPPAPGPKTIVITDTGGDGPVRPGLPSLKMITPEAPAA